jgi:hypothetical protein
LNDADVAELVLFSLTGIVVGCGVASGHGQAPATGCEELPPADAEFDRFTIKASKPPRAHTSAGLFGWGFVRW